MAAGSVFKLLPKISAPSVSPWSNDTPTLSMGRITADPFCANSESSKCAKKSVPESGFTGYTSYKVLPPLYASLHTSPTKNSPMPLTSGASATDASRCVCRKPTNGFQLFTSPAGSTTAGKGGGETLS